MLASTQFYMMRHVVHLVGIEEFGYWALLSSLSQVTKLFEGGISVNATKIVVNGKARSTSYSAAVSIKIGMVSSLYYSLIAVLLYIFTSTFSAVLLKSPPNVNVSLLCAAGASQFLLQSSASILANCLLAAHDGRLKSSINIISNIFGGLMCYWLTSAYGLTGYAFGNSVQFLIFWLAATLYLYTNLRSRSFIYDKSLAAVEVTKLLFQRGLALQGIGLSWSLLEFATRWTIGIIGGNALSGYYEIANKCCSQCRTLANFIGQRLLSILVDNFSRANPNGENNLPKVDFQSVCNAYYTMALISVAGLLVIWLPYKTIMAPTSDASFTILYIFLTICTAAQIFAIPHETLAVAKGELRWNLIGNFLGVIYLALPFTVSLVLNHSSVVQYWTALLAPASYLVASTLVVTKNMEREMISFPGKFAFSISDIRALQGVRA